MSRTDGKKTKKTILRAAERLFPKEGFRGTSVAEIAQEAGVNKALIYYYFKDKNDLIISLFNNIIEELEHHIDETVDTDDSLNQAEQARQEIESELQYLAGKKRIISLMLRESLKGANTGDFFFQCAEIVMQHSGRNPAETGEDVSDADRYKYLADEFFTGFIPMISFVVFRDKWCKYFKCDPDQALQYFLDAFERSHLARQAPTDDSP